MCFGMFSLAGRKCPQSTIAVAFSCDLKEEISDQILLFLYPCDHGQCMHGLYQNRKAFYHVSILDPTAIGKTISASTL